MSVAIPYVIYGVLTAWTIDYSCNAYTKTSLYRRKIELAMDTPFALTEMQAREYIQAASQWEYDSQHPVRYTASRLLGMKMPVATKWVDQSQWFKEQFTDKETLSMLHALNTERCKFAT